jgi:phosphonoacetate hydrolase
MGDVIVVSERHVVLGTSASRHDLSGLDAPLRSHGGISEQRVPLLVNRRAPALAPAARLRNFDVFDVALNAVA